MAIPTTPCIKKLLKIVVVLLIILAILAAAVIVTGLLKVSTLKLDTLEIAKGVTLTDVGLGDAKFFTVLKGAWGLIRVDKDDYIVNSYDNEDRQAVNEIFSKLPKTNGAPKYSSLLTEKAELNKGREYLYYIEDDMLSYVFEQVFASSDEKVKFTSSLGLQAKSVVVKKEDMTVSVAFTLDISAISSTLPDLKVVKWQQEAYLVYVAKMTVGSDGTFSLSDGNVSINGLDETITEAVLTAIAKTNSVEKSDKAYSETVSDAICDVVVSTVNNIGKIGGATIDSTTNKISADKPINYGPDGIGDGRISFISH